MTSTAERLGPGGRPDHDDHLVLRDPASGAVMVAELPDPVCVGRSSPLLPAVTASRAAFDAARATTRWRSTSTRVSLRGVGFFDDDHGQTGAAPNGVELHPVLRFTVLPPSTHGTLAPSAPAPSARRTARAREP